MSEEELSLYLEVDFWSYEIVDGSMTFFVASEFDAYKAAYNYRLHFVCDRIFVIDSSYCEGWMVTITWEPFLGTAVS